MSHLQYFAYKGQGEEKRVKFSYAQAVRVGDRIECAGQGMIFHFGGNHYALAYNT